MAANRRKYIVTYVKEMYRDIITVVSRRYKVNDILEIDELRKFCASTGMIFESMGSWRDKNRIIKILDVHRNTHLEAVGELNGES